MIKSPLIYKDNNIIARDDKIEIWVFDNRTLKDISMTKTKMICPLSVGTGKPIGLKNMTNPPLSICHKSRICTDMKYRSERIIINTMSEAIFDVPLSWCKQR